MKKCNFLTALLLFIAILISGCNAEKKEWENSKLENTVLVYEDFLNNYPEGLYSDSARIYLDSLYFKEALIADTITEYESFLQNHPQSIFVDSIQILLEELYFDQALELGTVEALKSFVEKYPSSKYVPVVNDKLRTIELIQRCPFKIIVGEKIGLRSTFAGASYTFKIEGGEIRNIESGGWLVEGLENKLLNIDQRYSGYTPSLYWIDQPFKISYNGKLVASFKNTDEYLKMIGQ